MNPEAFVNLYSELCNVVERNYQGIPLDEPGPYHTSSQARTAANRILELTGVEEPEDLDAYLRRGR